MTNPQQMMTMDEYEAGRIEQLWLEAVVTELDLKKKPGCEITQSRHADTNVTTLWFKNQPVAIAVRQRNDWNWTVLTTVRIDPVLDGNAFETPTPAVLATDHPE